MLKNLLLGFCILLVCSCQKDEEHGINETKGFIRLFIDGDRIIESQSVCNDTACYATKYFFNDTMVQAFTYLGSKLKYIKVYKLGADGYARISYELLVSSSDTGINSETCVNKKHYQYDSKKRLIKYFDDWYCGDTVNNPYCHYYTYDGENLSNISYDPGGFLNCNNYVEYSYYDYPKKLDLNDNGLLGKTSQNLARYIIFKSGQCGKNGPSRSAHRYQYTFDSLGYIIQLIEEQMSNDYPPKVISRNIINYEIHFIN